MTSAVEAVVCEQLFEDMSVEQKGGLTVARVRYSRYEVEVINGGVG